GLERDVEGGAPGAIARFPQRLHLGVRASGPRVKPLPHPLAVADHDGAHHGVGGAEPTAALRQRERARHPAAVLRNQSQRRAHHASVTSPLTNTVGSNGWRSSSCSPTPTSLIGRPSSRWMRITMPPLAVPSSLVR